MKFKIITYKTLLGMKEVVEIPEKNLGQFVIYKDKKPTFFVDCFDYNNESNQILNGLLLARRITISEILSKVNKKEKQNLTIETAPLIEIELNSEMRELKLKPFPLKWLN